MSDIHAYQKIVELQQEIVKLSHRNAELDHKCKQLQAELLLEHEKRTARDPFTHIRRSGQKRAKNAGVAELIRPGNLARVIERVWQAILS